MNRENEERKKKLNSQGYYNDADFDWDKFYKVNGVKPKKEKSNWLLRNYRAVILILVSILFYVLYQDYKTELLQLGNCIIESVKELSATINSVIQQL